MRNSIPNWVVDICKALRDVGEEAYVVGGAIRDTIIGRTVHEYDMCSSAKPETIHEIFDKAIDTGAGFGTVTVVVRDESGEKQSAEITTFRVETEYSDSRRPDSVTLGVTLEEDLGRRDFTINALAYDPLDDRLVDLHNGQADIKKKCLKTIGKPEERFREDTLRLFRAARFSAQLGFEIEADTLDAVLRLGPVEPLPAIERMTMEVKKIVASTYPSRGFNVLKKSKLLSRYMPGINVESVDFELFDTTPHHHRLGRLLEYTDSPDKVLKEARYSNAEIELVQRQIERDFDDELVALDPHDLEIKSQDLMVLGLEGPQLGGAQKALFRAVCQKQVANSKDELLAYFKTQIQETL